MLVVVVVVTVVGVCVLALPGAGLLPGRHDRLPTPTDRMTTGVTQTHIHHASCYCIKRLPQYLVSRVFRVCLAWVCPRPGPSSQQKARLCGHKYDTPWQHDNWP